MVPNSGNKILKDWEIAVMSTLVPRELPHTFYRIQIRAIGWQEIQLHNVTVFMKPGLELPGMVPPRVVHDDKHRSIFPAVPHELFQEQLKGASVKGIGTARDEASVLNANRAEQRHTLAGGRVQQDRIRVFRRYPHGAS